MPSLGWRWPRAVVQLPLDSQEGYQPAGCCRIHSFPADLLGELVAVRSLPCRPFLCQLLRVRGPMRASAHTSQLECQRLYNSQQTPNYTLNLPTQVTTLNASIEASGGREAPVDPLESGLIS